MGIFAEYYKKRRILRKILSDAFVQILDGNHAIEQEALQQNLSECVTEKMLSMQLSTLKRELLEEMESIYGNAIPAASQTGDHRDEMEQEQQECQRQICRMQ